MPSLERHIQLSRKRTGKEFRELHLWMDSRELGLTERIKRHDILEIPKNFELIEKRFGKEAAQEFLWHLKDDYERAEFRAFMKMIGKIGKWF